MWVYSHNVPIGRRKCGYIPETDQSGFRLTWASQVGKRPLPPLELRGEAGWRSASRSRKYWRMSTIVGAPEAVNNRSTHQGIRLDVGYRFKVLGFRSFRVTEYLLGARVPIQRYLLGPLEGLVGAGEAVYVVPVEGAVALQQRPRVTSV
eukprot:4242531-Pyramimonas_sp.AAC.1